MRLERQTECKVCQHRCRCTCICACDTDGSKPAQSLQGKCNLRTKKSEVSACTVPTTVSKPQPPPIQENPALSTIVASTAASYSEEIALKPHWLIGARLHSLDTSVGLSVHFGQCQDAPYCNFWLAHRAATRVLQSAQDADVVEPCGALLCRVWNGTSHLHGFVFVRTAVFHPRSKYWWPRGCFIHRGAEAA